MAGRKTRTASSRGQKDSESAFKTKLDDDLWTCKLCNTQFCDDNDKVIECDRCREHFCAQCLDMGDQEYNIMAKTTSMWFCAPCQVLVQKIIHTEIDIEKKCAEAMRKYEARIKCIEASLAKKCEEKQVRDIVKEELAKMPASEKPDQETAQKNPQKESDTRGVISELEDRKRRESNIMIFGIKEQTSEDGGERRKGDEQVVRNILSDCKVQTQIMDGVKRVSRIGRFDKEKGTGKKGRPILVVFNSMEDKRDFFKNIQKLKDYDKYSTVSITNYLTKQEREKELELREEAKQKTKHRGNSCTVSEVHHGTEK